MMMDHHQQHAYSNDPEVVPESNLETLPDRLADSGPQKEQYTASGQQYDTRHGASAWDSSFKDAPKSGNGKTRLILIGSAILIAIVSGVIGGIVGWQVTENRLSSRAASTEGDVGSTSTDTESDTSNSSSSSGSSRTCATNGNLTSASVVRNGTSLAATGWRYGNQHVIWLYFQGIDDTLHYVVYDTIYGTWAGPTMLSVEDGAVGGTALTATTLLWARSTGAPPEPQPQVVYQDTSGTLKGVAWRPGWPSEGVGTLLDDEGFTATDESALAGLAPGFYLQLGNGSVSETILNGKYTDPKTLPISPASGTPLLAVPRTKSHTGNELRLFFRREMDGQIAVFERSPDFTAAYDTDAEPALPFGTVGENSNIAGFTTARSVGTSDLNTMILLQDVPSGDITYTWAGDSAGWQTTATDSVFEGADAGGIACLTAATTWDGYGVKPLEVSNDMNKCYFVVDGRIKEVWWDGSSWTDNGFI